MHDDYEKMISHMAYLEALRNGDKTRAEDIATRRIRFRHTADGKVEEYRTTNALFPMAPGEVPALTTGPKVDWFGDN